MAANLISEEKATKSNVERKKVLDSVLGRNISNAEILLSETFPVVN